MRHCVWVIFLFTALHAMTVPFSHQPLYNADSRFPDFVSLDDPEGQPPPLPTEAYIWYDENNLYVEFHAVIDSTCEQGVFTPRDERCSGDYVRIQIRTCPNDSFIYCFYAYPLGNLADCSRTGLNTSNYKWDSHYSYSTAVKDSLWTVRMVIPFKDMRIIGKAPYHWTVNLLRELTGTEYTNHASYGYPIPDTDHTWNYYMEKMLPVALDHEVSKAHNYRLNQYIQGKYDQKEGKLTLDPEHVGANLEYRPWSNMSLKATVNPDFSEVPPDDEEDTSNLQYAQYLDENRFFFTEDMDAFDISDYLLYTRAIAQPQYAVKLTGNTNHFTYALINAKDKKVTEDGIETNADDIYTIVGLRPHTTNFSLQMDFMNRCNPDEQRDAWTAYAKPMWVLGTHHEFYLKALYTDDIRPDRERRRGTWFGFDESAKYGDYNFGLNGHTNETSFAPAIASPGTDEDNGVNYLNPWFEYYHSFAQGFLSSADIAGNASLTDYYRDHLGWSRYYNGNISLISTIDASIFLNGSWGSVIYDNALAHMQSFTVRGAYFHYKAFNLAATYSNAIDYKYDLQASYRLETLYGDLYGRFAPHLTYDLYLRNYSWHSFPTWYWGDRYYNVGNVNLSLSPVSNLFITTGLRYNDYEYVGYALQRHLGAFVTVRYDYSGTYRFYLGYNGITEEWDNNYEELTKTFWFKASASL